MPLESSIIIATILFHFSKRRRESEVNGMDGFEIHESDLFEHEPYTVDCLELDERQGILAVARHSDFG